MSRVDEALARARRTSATVPPATQPVQAAIVPGSSAAEWPDEESQTGRLESAHLVEPAVAEAAAPEAAPSEPAPAVAVAPTAEPEVDVEDGIGLAHLSSSGKLITSVNADASAVEQFRRLAAQLYLSQGEHGTRTVMVISALPGEGKTLTAVNLALTLSESYRRAVLLVDGDLRRPCTHQVFQVPNLTGLNDGIRAEIERKVPLIRITPHLSLLTAGRPDTDPMSVLTSERMQRVLAEAREKFEWVVIDTPPLGVLTDANLLASIVDVAVLVIQAGKTPSAAVKRVVDSIGRDRIAGVVLNRVERKRITPEYGYYEAVNHAV